MKYVLFNNGVSFAFDPRSQVTPENSKRSVNALEYYKDFARMWNTSSVYILDNKGEYVLL